MVRSQEPDQFVRKIQPRLRRHISSVTPEMTLVHATFDIDVFIKSKMRLTCCSLDFIKFSNSKLLLLNIIFKAFLLNFEKPVMLNYTQNWGTHTNNLGSFHGLDLCFAVSNSRTVAGFSFLS